MSEPRRYPVRAYWVFDPAEVRGSERLVFAASGSCALSKVCESEGRRGWREDHLCVTSASSSARPGAVTRVERR